MKSYKFEIKAEMVIQSHSAEGAENWLRASFDLDKELFNMQVKAQEIPNLSESNVNEEYEVEWK